jgi:uncharacterized membrane protein
MLELPDMPNWSSIHPFLAHFPIVIFLVVPIFIIIGIILKKNSKYWFYSATALMIIGLLSIILAIISGETSAELVKIPSAATDLVAKHKETSETVRNVFAGLTILYFLIQIVPVLIKKNVSVQLNRIVNTCFLILYFLCCVGLLNTAQMGGKLVHKHGISVFIK